ncbi:hypothetical protein BJ170DRAFT_148398 [Xylariales sp. AK1849]|nr:hypothetical protein BJ170DRAFT_148398 [Xylariales sp. AK1849]
MSEPRYATRQATRQGEAPTPPASQPPRKRQRNDASAGGSDEGAAARASPESEDPDWSDESSIYNNDDNESNDGEGEMDIEASAMAILQSLTEPLTRRLALRQLERLSKVSTKHKKWLQENRPALVRQDLTRFIEPLVYDNNWSAHDEQNLQGKLASDAYYQYLGTVGIPASNKGFFPMWRKIMGIMQCLPTDIVGPKTHLVSTSTTKVSVGGSMVHNPIWSQRFCKRLSRLALGGPCGENPKLLGLFIRWAVASRMDDRRRRIPFSHGTGGDPFFSAMSKRLYDADGSKSVVAMHQEVRRELRSIGIQLPWYSKVMRNIEKQLYERADPSNRDASFASYEATTSDLLVIEKAFNSCQTFGVPTFANVGDKYRIVSHTRKFKYPKTDHDVREIYTELYASEQRSIEKANNLLVSSIMNQGVDDGEEVAPGEEPFPPRRDDGSPMEEDDVSPRGELSARNDHFEYFDGGDDLSFIEEDDDSPRGGASPTRDDTGNGAWEGFSDAPEDAPEPEPQPEPEPEPECPLPGTAGMLLHHSTARHDSVYLNVDHLNDGLLHDERYSFSI